MIWGDGSCAKQYDILGHFMTFCRLLRMLGTVSITNVTPVMLQRQKWPRAPPSSSRGSASSRHSRRPATGSAFLREGVSFVAHFEELLSSDDSNREDWPFQSVAMSSPQSLSIKQRADPSKFGARLFSRSRKQQVKSMLMCDVIANQHLRPWCAPNQEGTHPTPFLPCQGSWKFLMTPIGQAPPLCMDVAEAGVETPTRTTWLSNPFSVTHPSRSSYRKPEGPKTE